MDTCIAEEGEDKYLGSFHDSLSHLWYLIITKLS